MNRAGAHVIWIRPRKLLGRWGPVVCGLLSDAPPHVFSEWFDK
jgi:hypothetical protein